MATCYYSLSTKCVGEDKRREIMIRFSHGKINQRAKSRLFVAEIYWDISAQNITIPKKRILSESLRKVVDELSALEQQLIQLRSDIISAFISDSVAGVSGNQKWLQSVVDKSLHSNSTQQTDTFFSLFDEFIEKRRISTQRRAICRVVKGMTERYERVVQIKEPFFTLSFATFTKKRLQDFEEFLRIEHTLPSLYPQIYGGLKATELPQPRGQNTISDRLETLRAFFFWAVNMGYCDTTPFAGYRITPPIYGTPIYITIEERDALYNATMPTQSLEVSRDIFVFQCLVACRVGDLVKLTKDNVVDGVLEYIPRKTKEGRPITVSVPLHRIALEIIAKYDKPERTSLLPFFSAQKYNDNIKECFRQAGLDRKVVVVNQLTREPESRLLYEVASSHMARRTFIGNLYKKVKDPNLVGALSGHKEGSRAFARYRAIDDDMKRELVNLLE